MKNKFLLLLFLINFIGFSQEEEKSLIKNSIFYHVLGASVPLTANSNDDAFDHLGNDNNSFFVPDGLSIHGGYGIHVSKWLGIGVNSGLDWKLTDKLVSIPIYGNLRVSPKVGAETRITLQAGYGKSFAVGRVNLDGTYRKISLGIEDYENILIYIEAASFGYQLHQNNMGSLSIGLSFFTF